MSETRFELPMLLHRAEPPWIVVDVVTDEDLRWLPQYLYARNSKNSVVRKLRGRKMTSREFLMNEFGAAMQFFDGFGENYYALKDCLCYLDESLPGDEYILVITDAYAVLVDEEPQELAWLVQTLQEASEFLSTPIKDNDSFNRDALPFHTVLQCRQDNLEQIKRRYGNLPVMKREER